jgi:hypothetical protein
MEGHHVQICRFAFVLPLLSSDASVCTHYRRCRILHAQGQFTINMLYYLVAVSPRLTGIGICMYLSLDLMLDSHM